MANGNLYQVKFNQGWGAPTGKPILNVFYFRQNAGSVGSEALLNLLDFYYTPLIKAIQTVSVYYKSWEAINLDDPGDYAVHGVDGDHGEALGETLPRFVCWSFIMSRVTRACRNGHKRFCGVGENFQASGILDGTAMADALSDLANVLDDTLPTADNSANWSPRIYRPHTVRPGKPDLERADFPIGAVVYQGITTQNSRK